MYFSEHKFVVEIDKKGHIYRNQNKENETQIRTEKYPDCKFFHRINPDVEGFDTFLEISKIQNYTTQSNDEKPKIKFAEELLNYISAISKPLKHIRYFVEKILPTIQKMVEYDKYRVQWKEKPINAQQKAKIVFSSCKSMHMYRKYCKKKHTGNMFPKILVLISKNKIKGKSKCDIFFFGYQYQYRYR